MNHPSTTTQLYNYLRQYEWLRRIYRESRTALHITQNRIRTLGSGNLGLKRRRTYLSSISKYNLPLAVSSPEQFLDLCKKHDIQYSTGRHSIYLPPQEALGAFLGAIVHDYPTDTGFKILRNFQSPDKASYIANGDLRRLTKSMMGPVTNQALAANALAALDLGPPCYGIAHLQSGSEEMTAFAVRHVEGDLASPEDCEEFVNKLRPLVSQGLLELVPVRGLNDPDFLPPHCNFNLLRERSTGQLMYIDCQQLLANQQPLLKRITENSSEDVHFGGSSRFFRKGKKYLYQSVPGLSSTAKRDTDYRWKIYRAMLEKHGVQVSGKVVLDVCCNTGVMLAHAIGDGAAWGIGWDLPNVVPHSRKVMQVLGAACSTLIPTQLSPEYEISSSVPEWLKAKLEGSVLFYLAAIQHVGIIRDLANIPWKTVFFEDHEGITNEEADENLRKIQNAWNCQIVWRGRISDGDCGSRNVAILQR